MQGGLSAAVFAFLTYNYFFLPPLHTFTISDTGDLVALLVFFAVAAASGSLAGRLREVAEQARARSHALQRLNALVARLSGAATFAAVADVLADEAQKTASGAAVVFERNADELAIASETSAAFPPSSADWQAAGRSAATRSCVYPAAPGWPGPVYAFYPVVVRDNTVAVLGVRGGATAEATCDATLRAMAHHTAIAWERLSLQNEKAEAQKQAEAERLRAALLSSVSHDIKTPLASIQGSVTSLRQLGAKLPDEAKADLLLTIEEEAERLVQFVTNLLDMTRLQAGAPDIAADWIDLGDTVSATVRRVRHLVPGAKIRLSSSSAPALVRGNATLLDHVIFNMLDNAIKFSDPGGEIRVTVSQSGNCYVVTVEDDGAGIPGDELPHVFEKFYRGTQVAAGGSGLGLAIAKEVMTALGGRIWADSPLAQSSNAAATSIRGTRVTLEFPRREVERPQEQAAP